MKNKKKKIYWDWNSIQTHYWQYPDDKYRIQTNDRKVAKAVERLKSCKPAGEGYNIYLRLYVIDDIDLRRLDSEIRQHFVLISA